jgi:methylase of polypeptide subunit release factors
MKPSSEDCVYEPSDDTYLLLELLDEWLKPPIVKRIESASDLGTGNGIVARYLSERLRARVVATDISPYAVSDAARRSQSSLLLIVQCNAGSCLRGLDLIVFNPPYLPEGSDDSILGSICDGWLLKAFSDPDSMLQMCIDAASKARYAVAAVYSSLSPVQVEACLESHGFQIVKRKSKRFFFEEIVAVIAVREAGGEGKTSTSRG